LSIRGLFEGDVLLNGRRLNSQPLGAVGNGAVSNVLGWWLAITRIIKKGVYLPGNAAHLTEDSSGEGALSAADGSDNGSETILLDGHVDIMDESAGLLRTLIGSKWPSFLAHSKDPFEIRIGSVLTGWASKKIGVASEAIKKL
jgi:hypothetical protein